MNHIMQFQKFPMWMSHPQQTETNLRPILVRDEEQVKAYESKGYTVPNMDVEFFNDVQVQSALAKQLIAVMLDSTKRSKEMGQIMFDHGQLLHRTVEMQSKIHSLQSDIVDLKMKQALFYEALDIVRAFLHKKFPKLWSGQ